MQLGSMLIEHSTAQHSTAQHSTAQHKLTAPILHWMKLNTLKMDDR